MGHRHREPVGSPEWEAARRVNGWWLAAAYWTSVGIGLARYCPQDPWGFIIWMLVTIAAAFLEALIFGIAWATHETGLVGDLRDEWHEWRARRHAKRKPPA